MSEYEEGKILIIGDVAYPDDDLFVDIDRVQAIILNLEGYLADCIGDNRGLFNSLETLLRIKDRCETSLACLANNHINDNRSVTETVQQLIDHGIKFAGAGKNLAAASAPTCMDVDGLSIGVFSSGWDLIGCEAATNTTPGVSIIRSTELVSSVASAKQGQKFDRILIYLHWGYELEAYPLPMHRNLAADLVQAGADIIIGCHSHCIQGFEIIDGKPVFYGIGNAIFKNGFYHGGKIKMPALCDRGLAVYWNPKINSVDVADCYLAKNKFFINQPQAPELHDKLSVLSRCFSLKGKAYYDWFKENRRKKLALPIFVSYEGTIGYAARSLFLKFRGTVIKALLAIKIKSGPK